jgi:hypothetical protein
MPGLMMRRIIAALSPRYKAPKKKGASPQQYVDRLSGEPARRQVRCHRACEVERPLYDPGAKKEYRKNSDFRIGGCSRSLRE